MEAATGMRRRRSFRPEGVSPVFSASSMNSGRRSSTPILGRRFLPRPGRSASTYSTSSTARWIAGKERDLVASCDKRTKAAPTKLSSLAARFGGFVGDAIGVVRENFFGFGFFSGGDQTIHVLANLGRGNAPGFGGFQDGLSFFWRHLRPELLGQHV